MFGYRGDSASNPSKTFKNLLNPSKSIYYLKNREKNEKQKDNIFCLDKIYIFI